MWWCRFGYAAAAGVYIDSAVCNFCARLHSHSAFHPHWHKPDPTCSCRHVCVLYVVLCVCCGCCTAAAVSGKLEAGTYALNANKGKKERIGRLMLMHANNR